MGLTFSTIFDSLASLTRWRKDQDVRILMIGLDAAGKTTILYQLHVRSMPLPFVPPKFLLVQNFVAWGGRIYHYSE
jgi:ADP-ribosylation factor-like protein 1